MDITYAEVNPRAPLSMADLQSYSKFAQLHSVIFCKNIRDPRIVTKQAKRVLRKKGDINYQIPPNSLLWREVSLRGGTLLHIACNGTKSEVVDDLLNLGADFTIKNTCGETALHVAFNMSSYFGSKTLSKCEADSIINLILSAHVNFKNSSNPCNKHGLSHFHIACTTNNTKAIEFFLNNGVDVNQAFGIKAFTPLHFAVKYGNIETIEVLLKYGADCNPKNADGLTPVLQVINRRLELLDTIHHTNVEVIQETLINEDRGIEKILPILLGNNFLEKVEIVDSIGLSSLHIACTMFDPVIVENLLDKVQDINHCVNLDSQVWPGYSAMHFAAHCDTKILQILHKKGANIDMKNAEGLTPFDICLKVGYVEHIHSAILLKPEWANILFSDNKTTLANFLSALVDTTQLNNFFRNIVQDVNMNLPNNSPIWPGCTLLHLAVIISKKYQDPKEPHILLEKETILEQIEELLKIGADTTLKDTNGSTSLHYAFRQKKIEVSKLLRKYHHISVNPVDNDNLSHLHIACAEDDESLVEKLLSNNNTDVNIPYKGVEIQNIKPGWTPLQCITKNTSDIKEKLVQHGARNETLVKSTLKVTLHSACDEGDIETVQRLLEQEDNVNLVLADGSTILHHAVTGNSTEVIELLLQRGADLFAKDNKNNTPFSFVFGGISKKNAYRHRDLIFSFLKQNEEMQRRMEKETGITMLHIACFMLDVEELKSQLGKGAHVDARVHKDSKVWTRGTPMHVLMRNIEEVSRNVNIITKLLLDNGSDVTLVDDDENETPVYISYCTRKDRSYRTRLLLKYQRDFTINPVNSEGVSHFHLAVLLNDVESSLKFIENGVNVNQPPDYFSDHRQGATPLLMAINNLRKTNDLRIVDSLLTRGANVNLEDARGNSALIKALDVGSWRLHLIDKLLSFGADIHSEDINGATVFETLLQSDSASVEDIRFFLKRGCRANFNNPAYDEGYLGIVLTENIKSRRQSLFEEMMKAPDVGIVNEFGRTLIHNVVAVKDPEISIKEYVNLFNRFKKFGYDVDDQDHEGQTALHLAARYVNEKAILALLTMGADMNIIDSKGNTPFFYVVEPCKHCPGSTRKKHYHGKAIEVLVLQVEKMDCVGLYVCPSNYEHSDKGSELIGYDDETKLSYDFFSQVDGTKDFSILPLSLNLDNFLSERKAVIKYTFMSELSRNVIDNFFRSIDNDKFNEILSLLNLQYRKAVTRFNLIQETSTLKLLIDFPLPELCMEIILSFLTIADLKNVVSAIHLAN